VPHGPPPDIRFGHGPHLQRRHRPRHHAQPWQFHIAGDAIQLYADDDRALPVIDRDGRQRYMSCGAALLNLRLAIRRFGHADEVAILPDRRDPRLVAIVRRGNRSSISPEALRAFEAIPNRHTNRRPFARRPVSQAVERTLTAAVHVEEAWLERLHPNNKYLAAELIAEADRLQFHDAAFRRELASWLRPPASRCGDGIPTVEKYEHGLTARYSGPLVVRTFDIGKAVGAREADLVAGSPVIAVLGTAIDTPAAWVRAGQAMQRMLLMAHALGLAASFLNQPLELTAYRDRFAAMTKHAGFPQLVLRLGYASEPGHPTPRRPLADALRHSEG
jgi:nitroreductase